MLIYTRQISTEKRDKKNFTPKSDGDVFFDQMKYIARDFLSSVKTLVRANSNFHGLNSFHCSSKSPHRCKNIQHFSDAFGPNYLSLPSLNGKYRFARSLILVLVRIVDDTENWYILVLPQKTSGWRTLLSMRICSHQDYIPFFAAFKASTTPMLLNIL